MAYEHDMTIIYDALTRSSVVSFRGKLIILKGPFLSQGTAIAAGEDFCRGRGWVDVSKANSKGS
jgi:hypothetical protein